MNWDKIEAAHFTAQDAAGARALFRNAVSMVEIEVFSYCNRRCWFCPNVVGDRIGENHFMSEEAYLGLLGQLAEIDYAQTITYSRYNEPLADRIILTRIAQARAALPRATLHTNTNGDYLNHQYLLDLKAAGLNSINVQIYLQNEQRYDHAKAQAKAAMMIRKFGVPARLTRDEPGVWLEYELEVEGLRARLYARNFDVNGTSRGDTVDIARDYVRNAPCLIPVWAVYIDYNGAVMPCCNVRSDIPAHADAVVGRLGEAQDIYAIFAGPRLTAWRRALVEFGEKGGVCRSCRFLEEPDTPEVRAQSARALALRDGAA